MDITYRLARSVDDKRAAAAMVERQYQESGYAADTNGFQEKMTHFLEEENSRTFLGSIGDVPLATVSVIVDTPRGLPLDELYQEETDRLRAAGKRLAEVSQLAVDNETAATLLPEKIQKRNLALFPLFRLVLAYALKEHLDALCIAVNPKHEVFYDALGFETFGTLKHYPSFNQAPAIAKKLDLHTLDQAALKNNFLLREIAVPPDPAVLSGEETLTLSV